MQVDYAEQIGLFIPTTDFLASSPRLPLLSTSMLHSCPTCNSASSSVKQCYASSCYVTSTKEMVFIWGEKTNTKYSSLKGQ
uniref:Uncharacterized protein n=1 Tax=Rhizophora mucronata TaxID=61149 RepID=A0A2P2IRE7_RHIMU